MKREAMLTQNQRIPRILPLNREILQNPVPLPSPPANPVHATLHRMLGLMGKNAHPTEKNTRNTASMPQTLFIEPVRIPAMRPAAAHAPIPTKTKSAFSTNSPKPSADTVWIEPFLARMTPTMAPAVNKLKTRATEFQSRASEIKTLATTPLLATPKPEFKINYSFGDTHALHTIRTGYIHRFVAPHQRNNPDVKAALSLLDAGVHSNQLASKMGNQKARRVLRTIQAAANRNEWHAARHAK